jgi:hypothetical protein
MTAKQIVLKKFPTAHAYQWAGPNGWVIYAGDCDPTRRSFGSGSASASQAWEAARKELRLRRRSESRTKETP